MKVIVASDSFKGSLSSSQVASAVRTGLLEAVPGAEVTCIEIADGGEGLVAALAPGFGAMRVAVKAQDPLGRSVLAEYAIAGNRAIIEMASCCGLPLLSPEERNPLNTSSSGLGQIILDALGRGCRQFLIGIGGSATNDAGTGMLSALGWKFLDKEGCELLGNGASLPRIAAIDASESDPRLAESVFTVACDVRNPFYGPDGAACVFAPQKGADADTVCLLDDGLCRFSEIILRQTGIDVQGMEGSGAAGGIGGAFAAFLGASLKPGAEMVLDSVGFDDLLEGASLVITGEGRIDAQTLDGKAVSAVLRRSLCAGVPVAAICGRLDDCEAIRDSGFCAIVQATPEGMDEKTAMQPEVAAGNVREAAFRLASLK